MPEKIARPQIENIIIKTIASGSLSHKWSCFSSVKKIKAKMENVLNYKSGTLNPKAGNKFRLRFFSY